ncbi:MAG: hypothetical protein M5U34_35950 [Chloroflexi bacterium]|nr:hypothetical protein [Chloroflexota bacterium]
MMDEIEAIAIDLDMLLARSSRQNDKTTGMDGNGRYVHVTGFTAALAVSHGKSFTF